MLVVPTSHAARFQPFLRALQDAGVDVERRLSREKLPSCLLYDPDLVASSRSVYAFVDRTARKEGVENISLLGSQKDGVENLEPWVRHYLLGATTLNQLLARYCQLAKKYIPYRSYTLSHENQLTRICTTSDASLRTESFLRYSDWSNLLLLLKVLRRVLGSDFTPTGITFQTKAPLTAAEREALQGMTVFQGCTTTSISLPNALLATPIPEPLRPSQYPKRPFDDADTLSFSVQMRQLLKPCLAEDWLDVNAAADMVCCSTRTLQRRLSATGLSFSQLLDQTRMEVAKTLLEEQDARIVDVSMEVGYADPAHFTRAFRRANGLTPSQYRHSIMANTCDLRSA